MKLSLLALSLGLVACGSSAPAPQGPAKGEAPASGPTATLTGVENADTACNLTLTADSGEELFLAGDFALCPGGDDDASDLIGKRVTWTTESANVLAAECEGDVDCGKSDTVELVVSITAVP